MWSLLVFLFVAFMTVLVVAKVREQFIAPRSESKAKQPATYGRWSYRLLAVAWLLILSPYWGGLFFHVHGAEAAMGVALYTSAFGCYLCIPIVFIALTGLLRREKPAWPAVVGLIGSAVPSFWAVSWLPGWFL